MSHDTKCFERGFAAGRLQVAEWMEREAARWPQDSLRKRIEGIVSDIRKTATDQMNEA
jgi:hypothetical protein